MYTMLLVMHVTIAIVLVIVVLLQSGKGGGLGAGLGGGGANTLFGSSGGSNFFTKLTMGLAAAFAVTSLSLTVVKGKETKQSRFDQASSSSKTSPIPAADKPAEKAPEAVPTNAADSKAEKPAEATAPSAEKPAEPKK